VSQKIEHGPFTGKETCRGRGLSGSCDAGLSEWFSDTVVGIKGYYCYGNGKEDKRK